MKITKFEVRNAEPPPLPVYTLCVFVAAFSVATGLCLWYGDVAAVLALLCLCAMTLIVVIVHVPPRLASANDGVMCTDNGPDEKAGVCSQGGRAKRSGDFHNHHILAA